MPHHYVVEQKFRQHFKLGLLEPDDFGEELAIHEETSVASDSGVLLQPKRSPA
jgi:hypothetical protein